MMRTMIDTSDWLAESYKILLLLLLQLANFPKRLISQGLRFGRPHVWCYCYLKFGKTGCLGFAKATCSTIAAAVGVNNVAIAMGIKKHMQAVKAKLCLRSCPLKMQAI